MRPVRVTMLSLWMVLLCGLFGQAQQTTTATNAVVPPLMNFSGSLTDANGKPLTGTLGVTFSLYADQQGGAPLWVETQNIKPSPTGRYTVMLGSATSQGIPANIFASGEARWLSVQVQGQAEQPRVLLVAVPYALKALDAETIGGKPPSAFALAAPPNNSTSSSAALNRPASPPTSSDVTTTGGTVNAVPLFTTATNIQNSLLTQTGSTAINVAGMLNVNNTVTVSGSNTSGVLQVTNQRTAGHAPAIVGTTDGSGASGVKGIATNVDGVYTNGVFGSSAAPSGYGVQGVSSNVGVYGAAYGVSKEGQAFGSSSGVWGDTAFPGCCDSGVLGTADENEAGLFVNNGSNYTTLTAENFAKSSSDALVFNTIGGSFKGQCKIDVSGNLTCTGKIGAAATVDSGARKVALYAMQSPENWLEDFGSGALVNGAATVTLDPTFTQTVNTEIEYHVFLTPKGDSEGLYVTHETREGFEVHEQRGGHSNIAFDYRIVAKRVGYENVRLADLTEQFNKQETHRKNQAGASSR